MNLFHDFTRAITRRYFFAAGSHAVGWAALASLLEADSARGAASAAKTAVKTHFPGKAKSVIYLHMVGGPGQMDLYDYKPKMQEWFDKDLPDSVRMGQRLTTMTSGQKRFPIAPSKFKFARTASAACGCPSCCRGRPRWSMICASSAACIPRPSTTSRPSPTSRPAIKSPAGLAWAPGSPMGWDRSTTICLPSSSSSPSLPTPSKCRPSRLACGRPATCPANMPASPSAPPATRFCSSTIHRVCRRPSAAKRSMACKNSTR